MKFREFLANLKGVLHIEEQESNKKPARPDYSGRLVMLNLEKVRRWQCFNFVIGSSRPVQMVPPDADQEMIGRALAEGILIDVTDSNQSIVVGETRLDAISETDTGKRAYVVKDENGMCSLVIPNSPEEQEELERRARESAGKLELPPGMDDEEKYLLKVEPRTN